MGSEEEVADMDEFGEKLWKVECDRMASFKKGSDSEFD